MCLLCCGGCAYAGYKTNSALDRAFTQKDEPVESYWKTELKHSLGIRQQRCEEKRISNNSYGSSRKMSKREKESRDRLQELIQTHLPDSRRGNG
jgi:hypothetical protein